MVNRAAPILFCNDIPTCRRPKRTYKALGVCGGWEVAKGWLPRLNRLGYRWNRGVGLLKYGDQGRLGTIVWGLARPLYSIELCGGDECAGHGHGDGEDERKNSTESIIGSRLTFKYLRIFSIAVESK